MRSRRILPAAVLWAAACFGHAELVRLYLVAGQSNAVGYGADGASLPSSLQNPQADIDFWYLTSNVGGTGTLDSGSSTPESLRKLGGGDGFFGPELTMGRALADAQPGVRVGVIKVAINGTALGQISGEDWNTGSSGELFDTLTSRIDGVLSHLSGQGDTGVVSGLAWLQGENDAKSAGGNTPPQPATANAYEANLSNLVGALRTAYNPDMRAAIGRVSITSPNSFGSYDYVGTVRSAQETIANAHTLNALVDTDDLTQVDGLHFDAASMQTLGDRYALALIPEPGSLLLAAAGLAALFLLRRR